MSVAQRSVYQLVDGILDEGLPFVASYLEKKINRAIMITDSNGQIHYPDKPGCPNQIDDMFIQLPLYITNKEYYYDKAGRSLYYRIEHNGTIAYIIVEQLPIGSVAHTISILTEAKLAIKCYFTNINKINKNKEIFERELAEYLFFKSNANIKDIIKLVEKDIDIHTPYLIVITEVDVTDHEIDWQIVHSYFREYLKKNKLDIVPIAWPNCLMAILPARFKNDTLEVDPDWPRIGDIIGHKEVIENRFNIVTSQGIGRIYQLLDLHKSYNEARLALTLPKLMGKQDFVQKFSELGVFSLIFSQDIRTIKKYCLETLGQLIEYDNKTEGVLLPTLRKLLDSSFNWKSTADSLFIHVNTLYYRVDKIERLLNADLSKMDTRTNLFSAIKVWDALKINGFLD